MSDVRRPSPEGVAHRRDDEGADSAFECHGSRAQAVSATVSIAMAVNAAQ